MALSRVYPDLITLPEVRVQVRQNSYDDDDRLEQYRLDAQDTVLKYCKVANTFWDSGLPGDARAAMMLVVTAFYEGTDPLADEITKLLWRYRDPAFA